jgi:hypothetical protein
LTIDNVQFTTTLIARDTSQQFDANSTSLLDIVFYAECPPRYVTSDTCQTLYQQEVISDFLNSKSPSLWLTFQDGRRIFVVPNLISITEYQSEYEYTSDNNFLEKRKIQTKEIRSFDMLEKRLIFIFFLDHIEVVLIFI